MTELVHQTLRPLRLLHDALLVILPDGSGQLVVVHGRPVLATSPQTRHNHRVFDLEDALAPVQPPDSGPMSLRGSQELLKELPQVNVTASVSFLADNGLGFLHFFLIWKGGGEKFQLIVSHVSISVNQAQTLAVLYEG